MLKRSFLRGAFIVMCISVIFSCGCANKDANSVNSGGNGLTEPAVLSVVNLKVAENLSGTQSERVVRTEGRTFYRNNGLACDFSCTGVRFNVVCKGDVSVKFRVSNDCYFTVYINGERQDTRLFVKETDNGKFVRVACFDTYGEREISVVKQSQYPMAYCEIVEIQFSGSFGKRPENRKRFIEFYGDSLLNGSNIYTGGTSVHTSDATYAFGYLTAIELNADCNIIGRGGMGLYPKDGSTDGMNEIWDLCGGKRSPEGIAYDFGRIPDCVVVELGINDCVSDYYSDERYRDSIDEMIFNIRSVYGDEMKIIWCYGYHEVFDAKWAVAKQTLDSLNINGNILFCKLPYAALGKDQGGDGWHPDVSISKQIAAAMTEFIEKNIYG